MSKLNRLFSSPVLAVLLLFTFAISMAVATFIENDYGTATAWKIIYNAWWFEMVMVGLGISFLTNIFKYKLLRKEKWAVLLFHISFILILIGAGITRYFSDGGIMRIREGASSNVIISTTNYLHIHLKDDKTNKTVRKQFSFSPLSNNDFTVQTDFNNEPIIVAFKSFVADAVPQIIDAEEGEEGKPMIQLVVSAGNGRETVFLERGEIEAIGEHQHKIGFNVVAEGVINITEKDGVLSVLSPRDISSFEMATEKATVLKKDSLQILNLKTLYRDGDASFVPLSYHKNGKMILISGAEKPKDNDEFKDDALVVDVTYKGVTKEQTILYREGFLPVEHELQIENTNIALSYGSMPIITPFSIHLDDFQLERYPGSTSPSAYASEVQVIDEVNNERFAQRIFMNNVLDYKGYRFFQASYDTDELGTVLAVNRDRLGTNVTYIGYILMMIGMFFTLFGKSTYFTQINKKLKKLKTASTVVLLMLFSVISYGQQKSPEITIKTIQQQTVDVQHADLFGRLMVQDLDGRIKPINTLASEFLRKLSRKSYFKFTKNGEVITLNANQTFLAMQASANVWQYIPIIKVDADKGGELFENFTISEDNFVSFIGLLDAEGSYILKQAVEEANKKKPAERSEFDKEVLNVDERFNILYNVFSGNYLKIFPNKNDENNKWHSHVEDFKDFPIEDGEFVKSIVPTYYKDVTTKNWVAASEKLEYIKKFQDVLGAEIIPSRKKVEAELWYNQLNINFWLFQLYFVVGFVLLIISLVKIFTNNKIIDFTWNASLIITLLSFVLFTGNIILRWYISGHAPWSNGYEMLVFVAWTLVLCGLLTFRKSDFSLPLATLFAGTLLFVSYLDWLSPEITNLMPVLKSFWLKVHVATIVSSYAPLALSAILGFMALLLMIFKTENTKKIINIKIKELTYINEIAMTIGLFVLTVGTFLGGVWANESWGRYWAWDPKETWALISIIVYSIVLHLRLIPALKSRYVLNMISVFAFGSIIMTSFGVNYYLSGLHSYAAGDPVPIPNFVYVITAIVILVSVVAYIRNKKFAK